VWCETHRVFTSSMRHEASRSRWMIRGAYAFWLSRKLGSSLPGLQSIRPKAYAACLPCETPDDDCSSEDERELERTAVTYSAVKARRESRRRWRNPTMSYTVEEKRSGFVR
jgi:hypothetical protein